MSKGVIRNLLNRNKEDSKSKDFVEINPLEDKNVFELVRISINMNGSSHVIEAYGKLVLGKDKDKKIVVFEEIKPHEYRELPRYY